MNDKLENLNPKSVKFPCTLECVHVAAMWEEGDESHDVWACAIVARDGSEATVLACDACASEPDILSSTAARVRYHLATAQEAQADLDAGVLNANNVTSPRAVEWVRRGKVSAKTKAWLVAVLLAALLSGCSAPAAVNTHPDTKVKSIYAWEVGRAKSCSLTNGNSLIQGKPSSPDPHEMTCWDYKDLKDLADRDPFLDGITNPDASPWRYVIVANVHVDAQSERVFRRADHFAVRVLCTRDSNTDVRCLYDGDQP